MDHLGPDTKQANWRDLFNVLREYEGDRGSDELIRPWTNRHPDTLRELREIGHPDNRNGRLRASSPQDSPLQGMYALSRVLDVLIAPYQTANDDPALLNWTTKRPWWTGCLPDQSALPALAEVAGWTEVGEQGFHPFFHEIVAVQPAEDPNAAPELVAEVWPGFLAGSLMLVRAGVIVRAGANVMDPQVASRSRMYWSWWRRNRVATDLSHGWGGNSQWGTDFRRDYIADGDLHYNVDGDRTIGNGNGDLPAAIAREVIRFRCHLLHDEEELFPFRHRLSEQYRPELNPKEKA